MEFIILIQHLNNIMQFYLSNYGLKIYNLLYNFIHRKKQSKIKNKKLKNIEKLFR